MAPRRTPRRRRLRDPRAGAVLEESDVSLLELIDNVLNKGVVVRGDVMLGLAGIDRVYLRLSVVLCAADRIATARP